MDLAFDSHRTVKAAIARLSADELDSQYSKPTFRLTIRTEKGRIAKNVIIPAFHFA